MLVYKSIKFVSDSYVSMSVVDLHNWDNVTRFHLINKTPYLINCMLNAIEIRLPLIVSLIELVSDVLKFKAVFIQHLSSNELSRLQRQHKGINKMPIDWSGNLLDLEIENLLDILTIPYHEGFSIYFTCQNFRLALVRDFL